MSFESSGTLLATGSSDHSAKIWNIDGGFCTHNFKEHDGIIHYLTFNPFQLHLITCSDDTKIRVWDLNAQTCIKILTEHLSSVTSISFSDNNKWMCTAGRDKVVNIYDSKSYTFLKTVLIYEELEGIQCISSSIQELSFVTAGENGLLRKWKLTVNNANKYFCQEEFTQPKTGIKQPFLNLLYNKKEDALLTITKEFNFIFYEPNTLNILNQISAYNDEIIDIKYIDDKNIVVASNSELVLLILLLGKII